MSQHPNDIGNFIIGQDPIGALPFDWYGETVISQWANSPTLLQLIDDFSQCIDPNIAIDNWYDAVWNVQTAIGYGLDVWGRIVGVNRVLPVISSDFFGFAQASDANGFGQAPFYNSQGLTTNYALSDPAFRLLVLAKAAANIWDGSIPGLNTILRLLFPGQICYVTDGLNMTMTYTFEWTLSPVQQSVIANSGVLPKPCGVSATVVQL